MTRPPFDPNLIKTSADEVRPAFAATLTVTQLTQLIKRTLEERLPSTIQVIGQISNFKRHSSGHLYFVLKDERSELSCVMWRSDAVRLKFNATDGLEVIATGHIDLFERSGRYQLYARRIEPRGVGALELAFRQLRGKLENEGLFDPTRKCALPRFPRRIAVVTSLDGAALRDILQTLLRRFPCVDVLVYPVAVQGPSAAGEIASAVALLNANSDQLGGIDVIIVGRGGGSLEDLWAFNEEVVARAIFDSRIPVISAVGHETDVTISDLVADVRAATPTAAAELATPVRDELTSDLARTARLLLRHLTHAIALRRASLTAVCERSAIRRPLDVVQRRDEIVDDLNTRMQQGLINRMHHLHRKLGAMEITVLRIAPQAFTAQLRERIAAAEHRMERSVTRNVHHWERRLNDRAARFADIHPKRRWERLSDRIDQMTRRLEALSHNSVLRRGFTLTRLSRGRGLLRSPTQVRDGELIVTDTAGGSVESRVVNLKQMELFDGP
ncbi:MAG: exodeoxyribonuclease VII large subunit [Phycisphaerales bacterium]|nr:exodeoxyribonuclease VII large subunit [Phycisphaerales bacterium]